MKKRSGFIDWNMYFMGVALLTAQRSKDPNTQVGVCIVNNDNKIISTGYNGLPNGYSDDKINWDNNGEFLNSKYAYVCHAELNAILNANSSLNRAKMYINIFPCNECAKAIIQSGISEVIFILDRSNGKDSNIAAKRLLDECNVKYTQYDIQEKTLRLVL